MTVPDKLKLSRNGVTLWLGLGLDSERRPRVYVEFYAPEIVPIHVDWESLKLTAPDSGALSISRIESVGEPRCPVPAGATKCSRRLKPLEFSDDLPIGSNRWVTRTFHIELASPPKKVLLTLPSMVIGTSAYPETPVVFERVAGVWLQGL